MKTYKFYLYTLEGEKIKLAEVCDKSQVNVLSSYYFQTYNNGHFTLTLQYGRQTETTIIESKSLINTTETKGGN